MLMSVRFLYRALSDYVRWAYFEYKVLMFLFLYTLKIDFDTGQDRSYCLSVCPSVNFFVLFLIVSNQSQFSKLSDFDICCWCLLMIGHVIEVKCFSDTLIQPGISGQSFSLI